MATFTNIKMSEMDFKPSDTILKNGKQGWRCNLCDKIVAWEGRGTHWYQAHVIDRSIKKVTDIKHNGNKCMVCGVDIPDAYEGCTITNFKRKYCSSTCRNRGFSRKKRGFPESDIENIRKCLECGKDIGINKIKFCSTKCMSHDKYRRTSEKYNKIRRDRNLAKRKKIELKCVVCGKDISSLGNRKKYCSSKCFKIFKKHRGKIYYHTHRDKFMEKEKEYRGKRENMDRHNKVSAKWLRDNPGKAREVVLLRKKFGTARIPLEVKQSSAIYHIGNRILCRSNIKPINKNDINKTIKLVQEGLTHAAYE